MSDCQLECVRRAQRGVTEELALFRIDSSEERLALLKSAINNWHDMVRAWSKANTIEPPKQNIS